MQIVNLDYYGQIMAYQDDGWFNATVAADKFGKRVDNWLRLDETQDYLKALCEISNTSKVRYLKTKRKPVLQQYAFDWRMTNQERLTG